MRGGKREGAGRKPGSVNPVQRNTIKQIRWTTEEWQQVEQAATSAGTNPSEFIRMATMTRAQEVR